jgi:soluble lytic murein transglycosylase
VSYVSRGRSGSVHSVRRGRLRMAVIAAATVAVIVGVALTANVRREHPLPLSDVAIIRAQAAEKGIDPALIAAVIYAETKFVPRESPAGAKGLMQILPSTAHYLARLSGGVAFTTGDLANPDVNIAYGSYYLRYLLEHYRGNELLAIAAYNAGVSNVDAWTAKAAAQGQALQVRDMPFAETRAYVSRVLRAAATYRRLYARQLGLR